MKISQIVFLFCLQIWNNFLHHAFTLVQKVIYFKGLEKIWKSDFMWWYYFRIDSLLFFKPCYSFHFLYHLSHKVCHHRFPLPLINIPLILRSRLLVATWLSLKCTLPIHQMLPCQGQTLSCIINPCFSHSNWSLSIYTPLSVFHRFKFLSKSAHKQTHSDLSCGKLIGAELLEVEGTGKRLELFSCASGKSVSLYHFKVQN